MTNPSDSGVDAAVARRQDLSALVDGELTPDGVHRICAAWRNETSSREAWHAYSLIGDVMRSGELASPVARDERFLRELRARMATEPVVLVPHVVDADRESAPAAARHRGGRPWRVSAAMAAGLMVVAGTMVVTQAPRQPVEAAVPMAAMPASTSFGPSSISPQMAVVNSQPESNLVGPELVFDGQVIRDPRLDRYLLAHKQFSGSSVLGAPSGFLRNAAAEVPAR